MNLVKKKITASCNTPKKRLWYGCFPVNFEKFLTTLVTEHHWTTASVKKDFEPSFLSTEKFPWTWGRMENEVI